MALRMIIGLAAFLLSSTDAGAQFRPGMLADSAEITLYPHAAPVHIVTRLRALFERQLLDNDSRLQVVPKGGGVVLMATIVE